MKELNKHVSYHQFKMDIFESVLDLLRCTKCNRVSSILLSLLWTAISTRNFQNILEPPLYILRTKDYESADYIDSIWLACKIFSQAGENVIQTRFGKPKKQLLESFFKKAFLQNFCQKEKSNLIPSESIQHVDSLPEQKM